MAGNINHRGTKPENPDKILSRVQDLGQVTQQSTKDAAIRYLGGNNLIKIILLPEKK
ncbi:hypothetical protein HK413_07915 [Mucilaginibacter sp. S1162]|uniref:Uncharacterized protein n=1 Tax=Mucilaginibacter humi TaxID=2732510 RepID=A0ABX1W1H5_9SPHI|nr:hypothetical protein [Mucilaginibacter humi]NNU34089.1 hypothetical protein [Mucilaginibacter humi]